MNRTSASEISYPEVTSSAGIGMGMQAEAHITIKITATGLLAFTAVRIYFAGGAPEQFMKLEFPGKVFLLGQKWIADFSLSTCPSPTALNVALASNLGRPVGACQCRHPVSWDRYHPLYPLPPM